MSFGYGTGKKYSAFQDFHETPKTYAVSDFSGGVSLDGDGVRALRKAVNMMPLYKRIEAVAAPEEAFPALPEGRLHGSICRGGLWLFGKGDSLFALRDGVLSRVGAAGLLSDGPCGIYETENGFAVISGDSVFFVNRQLQVTIPEMAVPILYENMTQNGENGQERDKPNFFCPHIDIIYKPQGSTGAAVFKIPEQFAVRTDDVRAWYADTGEEIRLYLEPISNGTVRLPTAQTRAVRIRLRLSDTPVTGKFTYASMAPYREMLASVREPISLSFPEAALTYIVPDTLNRRRFQVLALRGEADFCSLSESRLIGFQMSEQITGVVEYGEGLLVFTEGAVRRCRLLLQNGVLTPEMTIVKGDFGSDMPRSICRAGDKIVFASSRGGIFYLRRYGGEDREVCYHISRPIEAGEDGFFSHTATAYRNACAVCACGKYYLTVGDMTYVWDMGAKAPSAVASGGEEVDAVFTLMNVAVPCDYLATLYREVYFEEKGSGRLCRFSPECAENAAVSVLLETAESDLGEPRQKVLLSLTAEYTASEEVSLSLVYDGEDSPMVFTLPAAQRRQCVTLKLPQNRFLRMAVRLSSVGGASFAGLRFTYIPAEI